MKNLIKHKVFISAFLLTYFLFFVVTIFILDLKKDGFGVGHLEYGFPFAYYYSHCFGGYYLWFGLIGNILVAAGLSIVIGLVSTHFWLKFSSPEFRAKWHI
jgi:hypothetical protein